MGQCNKSAVKKTNQSSAPAENNSEPHQEELLTEEERIKHSLCQLFPDFKPVNEGDPNWQLEKPERCPECTHDFDFLTFYNHCRNCGQIYCGRCCYSREAMKGEKICGICMGRAMTVFRKRELSHMETRMRRNSELQRQQQQQQHQYTHGEGEQEGEQNGGITPPPEKCPNHHEEQQEGEDLKKKDEGCVEAKHEDETQAAAAEAAPAEMNKEEE